MCRAVAATWTLPGSNAYRPKGNGRTARKLLGFYGERRGRICGVFGGGRRRRGWPGGYPPGRNTRRGDGPAIRPPAPPSLAFGVCWQWTRAGRVGRAASGTPDGQARRGGQAAGATRHRRSGFGSRSTEARGNGGASAALAGRSPAGQALRGATLPKQRKVEWAGDEATALRTTEATERVRLSHLHYGGRPAHPAFSAVHSVSGVRHRGSWAVWVFSRSRLPHLSSPARSTSDRPSRSRPGALSRPPGPGRPPCRARR
jgi:hypothetical protein